MSTSTHLGSDQDTWCPSSLEDLEKLPGSSWEAASAVEDQEPLEAPRL